MAWKIGSPAFEGGSHPYATPVPVAKPISVEIVAGIHCGVCGAAAASTTARICSQCGVELAGKWATRNKEEHACAQCGQRNAPNDKFCSSCGRSLP
jgi:Double zinc ribbon